jgi:iron complex outermembrane receptor protein
MGALRDLAAGHVQRARAITQYLAIAAATQAQPAARRRRDRLQPRLPGRRGTAALAWTPADLAGAAVDRQNDDRRGFENFTGSGAAAGAGGARPPAPRREQRGHLADSSRQGEWTPASGLVASAGVRSGKVRLTAEDRYLSNGNDSGRLDFSYTNPVLGLRWTPAPGLNLHASVARGYESPTLGEVAYRLDSVAAA